VLASDTHFIGKVHRKELLTWAGAEEISVGRQAASLTLYSVRERAETTGGHLGSLRTMVKVIPSWGHPGPLQLARPDMVSWAPNQSVKGSNPRPVGRGALRVPWENPEQEAWSRKLEARPEAGW
jgi:hypothetical protein